jgi:predicted nucleic acid-binding protein
MSVVCDTTAITTLLKAKPERLLQELFEHVLVPQAVRDELKEFHRDLPDLVELHPVQDAAQRLPGTESLGRGEAEALLLAKQLNAQLLLTDDRKARQAARRLQIPCIGLVGMIVHAKRQEEFPPSAKCSRYSKQMAACICRTRPSLMPCGWLVKHS